MKAEVTIKKSFDDGQWFGKEWEQGDFKEFFEEEGAYIDRLCTIAESKAKEGEDFTITYVVTVTK